MTVKEKERYLRRTSKLLERMFQIVGEWVEAEDMKYDPDEVYYYVIKALTQAQFERLPIDCLRVIKDGILYDVVYIAYKNIAQEQLN